MQRKLTVILSADVVGYSGLMERDEAGTLERLKANRKAIFDPRVAAHGGRVFKLMGDGALVEFAQRRVGGELRAGDPTGDGGRGAGGRWPNAYATESASISAR